MFTRSITSLFFIFAVITAASACFIGCDAISPPAPIQVAVRTSLLTGMFGTKSNVLVFTNLSNEHLSIDLQVWSKDGATSDQWTFDLMAHEQGREVGVLETGGWAFEPGETIEIRVQGYRTRRVVLE